VTVGLEFGINQTVVYFDLEPASVRRDQGQAIELVLEFLEQIICQAHGPVGVVSYGAVDDFDVYHLGDILQRISSLSGATVGRLPRKGVDPKTGSTVERQVPSNRPSAKLKVSAQ
jgi:hypothetical protein